MVVVFGAGVPGSAGRASGGSLGTEATDVRVVAGARVTSRSNTA